MGATRDVDCELAGPAVDVAAHLLAHVAVAAGGSAFARAASAFDPAYVAWARTELPPDAIAPIVRDAPLLGASVARDAGARARALQWLLVLHDEAEQLRRAAPRPLEALTTEDVGSAIALAALVSSREAMAEIEIARCAIALAAPSYLEVWAQKLAPNLEAARGGVVRALGAVSRGVPAVLGTCVRLCQPLGRHGRAFPGQLLIGVPSGVHDVSPDEVAVRVVHEVAAEVAGQVVDRRTGVAGVGGGATERWALAEHLALEAAAARLAGTPFASAHQAFVARLDRSALDPRGIAWLEEVVDRMAMRRG